MKKKDVANKNTAEEKKKNILLIALKRHKYSLAFVLFFVFASTAFAWFIYNKTVDMGLNAHVKSWKVYMGDGDEGDSYIIDLEDLYPGMTPISGESIPISNDGEMDATVSIQIKSLYLFGEEQNQGAPGVTCDATIPRDDPNYVCDYTIAITTDASGRTVYTIEGYPFTLQFNLGLSMLGAGGNSDLNYSLTWAYESCPANDTSCDEIDTWYGEKSYEYGVAYRAAYRQEHPDFTGTDSEIRVPSLEVVMTLNFTEVTP